MLKIKDDVNLKELEKFGFKKEDDYYYLDFVPYNENDNTGCSYIGVEISTRIIDVEHIVVEDFSQAVDTLFDLIQAGLLEKVEEVKQDEN